MDPFTKSGPSKAWYVVGVIAILLTPVFPVLSIIDVVSALWGGEEFLVPGTHTLTVQEPGTYVLWHNAETFFRGQRYRSGSSLPDGMMIKIVHEESGEEITLDSAVESSESSGSRMSYSICKFRAEAPGRYRIEVSNMPGKRVFMVRKSLLSQLLATFLVCAVCGVVGWIGGPVLIILVAVKRNRAMKEAAEQTAGP